MALSFPLPPVVEWKTDQELRYMLEQWRQLQINWWYQLYTLGTGLALDSSDQLTVAQALLDLTGLAVTDGNFIVGDGTNWVSESGATARTSMGAQTQGDVLDDFNTLGAAASDGQIIVATGAGAFAYESGATARTSLSAQTLNANLTDISGLTVPPADKVILTSNGSNIVESVLYDTTPGANLIPRAGAGGLLDPAWMNVSTGTGSVVAVVSSAFVEISFGGPGQALFGNGEDVAPSFKDVIVPAGTNAFTADQSMGSNKLTALTDGSADSDAANFGQTAHGTIVFHQVSLGPRSTQDGSSGTLAPADAAQVSSADYDANIEAHNWTDGNQEGAFFQCMIPDQVDVSATININLYWRSNGTNTGDVEIEFQGRSIAIGESTASGGAAITIATIQAAPGTHSVLQRHVLAITGSTCAVGDMLKGTVFRDATAGNGDDTHTNTVQAAMITVSGTRRRVA